MIDGHVRIFLLFLFLDFFALENVELRGWLQPSFGRYRVSSAVHGSVDFAARATDIGLLLNFKQIHIVLTDLFLVIHWCLLQLKRRLLRQRLDALLHFEATSQGSRFRR